MLKRYWAACFALMYKAGRAGQLCLTKITDSNLAVSEENPGHAGGAGFHSRGRAGSSVGLCWAPGGISC